MNKKIISKKKVEIMKIKKRIFLFLNYEIIFNKIENKRYDGLSFKHNKKKELNFENSHHLNQ